MKIKVENLRRIQDEIVKFGGVAEVVLNDTIKIRTIKIIKWNNSLIVTMPSKKIKEQYKDVAHPTIIELRNQITNAVLNAYNCNVMEEGILEEMHVSDVRVSIVEHERLKAIVSIVLNGNFAIEYSHFIYNGIAPDGGSNYGLAFQVDQNSIPYVVILKDSLKTEILEKSLKAYKEIIEKS